MKHSRFSRKPTHKGIECWKMQYMLQNMTSIQQWEEWNTKDAIWCNIHNGSRVHNNHFTDNKHNNDRISDMTVDIGLRKDWSISDFKEDRNTTIDWKEYIDQIHNPSVKLSEHFFLFTFVWYITSKKCKPHLEPIL